MIFMKTPMSLYLYYKLYRYLHRKIVLQLMEIKISVVFFQDFCIFAIHSAEISLFLGVDAVKGECEVCGRKNMEKHEKYVIFISTGPLGWELFGN